MSARIEEILEVLSFLRMLRGATTADGTLLPFPELRKLAVSMVATQRKIDHTTVSDKFRRQLYPHIDGTDDFDRLASSWLSTGSRELESALSLHAVSTLDRERIRQFFREGS